MKKKKLKSISWLKKEADRVFSLWIRARDGQCVTCGGRTQLQNGHYIPRNWLGLRYNEKNCNTQDYRCNIALKGNLDEYALFLRRKYGEGILEELKALKVPTSFHRKDFEEVIRKYA